MSHRGHDSPSFVLGLPDHGLNNPGRTPVLLPTGQVGLEISKNGVDISKALLNVRQAKLVELPPEKLNKSPELLLFNPVELEGASRLSVERQVLQLLRLLTKPVRDVCVLGLRHMKGLTHLSECYAFSRVPNFPTLQRSCGRSGRLHRATKPSLLKEGSR